MSGWKRTPLERIFEIARGGSPRPIQNFLTDDPDGLNWTMIGDTVDGSKYISATKNRIRHDGLKKSRMVHEGDFLLTNSMSFGRPYILKTSGCIHDGWLVLSPKDNNVSPDFFYYLLGSDLLYREFTKRAAGAVVKNLNTNLVKSVEVPLPPLPEQKRIAGILDAADALRAKRRESLAQLDALLQSTFLDMFGDLVTNPKGWDECEIGSVGEVQGGLQLSGKRANFPSKRPYLRVTNVYRDFLSLEEIKEIRLTEKEAERTKLLSGDVLVVEGHGNPEEIGRCAVRDGSIEECVHQNHLIRVRLQQYLAAPRFASAFFNSNGGSQRLKKQSRTTSG